MKEECDDSTTMIDLDKDEAKVDLKRVFLELRQFFCRHDWDKNLIPYGYPVMSMIMGHGRQKICKKCRKLWQHPSLRPIYIRWWDRLFIRLGLLRFINPILRHDLEVDPEMKNDLPKWILK